MENNIQPLIDQLKSPSNVIITTHAKPDGDAMGSSLALYHFLKAQGHFVRVIIPDAYPGFLAWLPGINNSINFELEEIKAKKLISEAKVIFSLDYNALSRVNKLGDAIANSAASKVLIDHHLKPDTFDDYRLWDSNACSTCELIYDYILQAGSLDDINKDIADNIYTGIMTDTGSFRFPSTTSKVHRIIANLIDKGSLVGQIHQNVYDSYTENRLRFIGHILKEKMTIVHEYNMAYIAITSEERKKYNLVGGDTEGLVNYPLSMKNIKMAVMITDRTPDGATEKTVRMSFRSQGDIAVNEIASNHFSGGGHKNAAGGTSDRDIDTTVQELLDILPKYKSTLQDD